MDKKQKNNEAAKVAREARTAKKRGRPPKAATPKS